MKGLLKNNFMGVIENIKILFPIIFILGIVVFATGSASLLGIFSLTLTPVLSILIVLCLRKESLSKWYKYKISFPVKRNQIVKSYYISHLCWCIAGMVSVVVCIVITIMIHGNQYFYYGFRDAVTLVLGGSVLAIFIGAVFYPLYYFLGAEKIEIIVIISAVSSIAIVVGISMLINVLFGSNGVSDKTYYLSLIVILMISCISFVCSYFLSSFIFQTKEY